MKEEHLQNFIEFVTKLVHTDYHGDMTTTFNRGVITIGGTYGKIKFDNKNYKEYKDRINNKV